MITPVTIGLLSVHSQNYYALEYDVPKRQREKLERLAEKEDFRLIDLGIITSGEEAVSVRRRIQEEPVDYLLILNAGFSMGDVMMAMEGIPVPMGMWAVPEPTKREDIKLHSVVSMNLYASIAQRSFQSPTAVKWFYGDGESSLFCKRFLCTVAALRGQKALKEGRIGAIGEVAPTFYNLEDPKGEMIQRLSLNICRISVDEIERRGRALTKEEIEEAAEKIRGSASACLVSEEALLNGARVYKALWEVVKENNLDALAVSCWPDFQDRFSIVPCVPFTLLGDLDGIPVACEGDLGAAAAMLAAKAVSKSLPVLMDLTAIDLEQERILLWHCGIGSDALAPEKEKKRIICHPMMNRKLPPEHHIGLSYDYSFRQGPVNILRISRRGENMEVFSGRILDDQGGYAGTRGYIGQLSCDGQAVSALELFNTLMSHGVEHHMVLCSGEVEDAFREMACLCGMQVFSTVPYRHYLQEAGNGRTNKK